MTETESRLLSSIDTEELVELTRELVRIDSVIRPETGNTERRVVEFLRAWVRRELGLEPTVEEVQPGRENLFFTLDSGVPGPCLLLEGHTDVVSEGERGRWSVDPFGGELKEGRIYGRGACDMKAGLAVNLLTAKALAASGLPWRGRLRLCFVCDEEGMMLGIKDFIRRGHADGVDACLVPEPEENQLCLSMKGAIRAVVRVQGKMAHGAMPRTGINPNPRLARIILAYERYEAAESERCGPDEYLGLPLGHLHGPALPAARRPRPAQRDARGGRGYVDIRTVPGQDHEQVRGALRGILARAGAPRTRTSRPTSSSSRTGPSWRSARSQPIVGRRPALTGRHRHGSRSTTACRGPRTALS